MHLSLFTKALLLTTCHLDPTLITRGAAGR